MYIIICNRTRNHKYYISFCPFSTFHTTTVEPLLYDHPHNYIGVVVQGIRNKHLELAKLLHDHDVHISLLQETLLTEDNQYTISLYMTTRCICKKCLRITTLIRNDVQAEVTNTTRETDVEKHTDMQCIHVWPDNG